MQSELLRQRDQLRMIKSRLGDAIDTLLPPVQGDQWHGPAQLIYALGLARLWADALACADSIDEALRQTERALTTIGSYGSPG